MLMKLLEKSLAVEPSGWVAASGHLFLRASTGPRIGVVEDKGGD
jgi:hypothetical protein